MTPCKIQDALKMSVRVPSKHRKYPELTGSESASLAVRRVSAIVGYRETKKLKQPATGTVTVREPASASAVASGPRWPSHANIR